MTMWFPEDMRQTAVLSAVAHLILLIALTTVPLMKKAASQEMSSYQVMLISSPAPKAPREPVVKPSVPAPPVKAPPAPPAPPPPVPVVKPQERLTETLQQNMQTITLPKEISRPVPPETRPKPEPKHPDVVRAEPLQPLTEYRRPTLPDVESPTPPLARQEPISPQRPADKSLLDALKKADESMNKPAPAPSPPTPATAAPAKPTARTSEEINKLLSQLAVPPPPVSKPLPSPVVSEMERAPLPKVPRTSLTEDINRMLASAQAAPSEMKKEQAAPLAAAAPPGRAVTLERCPPKAQAYCPLLEAAINRAWNADSNPGLRQVLERVGDSAALVRIVIKSNGEVGEIALKESSGNESYDRAVKSILRELRAPPLPEDMKGEPFVAITSFKYTKKSDS